MIYIDTDVLVHAYVVQDARKNRQANEVIEQVNKDDSAVISTLRTLIEIKLSISSY